LKIILSTCADFTTIFSCLFKDLPIESSCKTCPEGYYCDSGIAGGVSNYTQYICPEGSYCPAGTTHDDQHLCPLGTFNNATGKVFSLEYLKKDVRKSKKFRDLSYILHIMCD
jgi:hypothetical protein